MPAPTLTFHIDGMNCASCVARVEGALNGIDGVKSAVVNLAKGTATVSGQALPTTLHQTLAKAGYPAQLDSLTLTIDGMNCASCIDRVQTALMAVPGVVSASINLASSTALVTYFSGSDPQAALINASTESGYPASIQLGEEPSEDRKLSKIQALKRQFIVAFLFTLPVFIMAMGAHMIPAFHDVLMNRLGRQNNWTIQFALTTVVLAWPGREFFAKGIPSLIKRHPDMNSLVALGSGAAWGFSVIATFVPAWLPVSTRAVYFEAAAVIVTLILLGRLLEARAKGQTGAAIEGLIGLQVKTAQVERDGVVSDSPISEIKPGDIILARPGDRIATDGEITQGESYIDESMISGEAVAVRKTIGSKVIGGTVNGNGAFRYRAVNVGDKTVLAQIIRMVEQAQATRLPVQDLVNKIAAWFVPAVLLIALLTIGIWLIFGPEPALPFALVSGVSVLIVACPCAMGLATPTSIMVGTGTAARMGVLFRKGTALQSLQAGTVVALDKTGTLTVGKPQLTNIQLCTNATSDGSWSEDEVLAMAAAVESVSEHPIAMAIVEAARTRSLILKDPSDFESYTGAGVQAVVDDHKVLLGTQGLMNEKAISLGEHAQQAHQLASQGNTPLFVAIDDSLVAVLGVADAIKPSSPEAIAQLQAMGLRVVMMSGDNQDTAKNIARSLNIDEVKAELLPEAKAQAIDDLRQEGHTVIFVGDGINDAPALATADTGIAIGNGTDIAIESADVVLMSGDLMGVTKAILVSRKTMQNIRQNLIWAFAYNVILIPVAAGALYPFFGVLLSPMLAAVAMSLSSIAVLSNALRLRWIHAETRHTAAPL